MRKYFIFILLIWHYSLYAQEKTIHFERISTQQGLSQSSVLCMLQDSKGFLWLGTSSGLNRYDGYEFTVFNENISGSTSIEDSHITALAEDKTGLIWIGTLNGLASFDRKTEHFTNYYIDSLNTSLNGILAVVPDDKGDVWVASREGGLFRFDVSARRFFAYPHEKIHSHAPEHHESITALCRDRQNFLWIGTSHGLIKFDIKKEKFVLYAHAANDPYSISDDRITSVFVDRRGDVWAGTFAGGINRLDKNSGRFIRYNENPLLNRVVALYETRSGDIWFGGYGSGLNKLDKLTGKLTSYKTHLNDPFSLSDNDVVSLLEDQSGIFWVGTYGGGVNHLDIHHLHFIHFGYMMPESNVSVQNGVQAIVEHRGGNVWIGTESEGLIKYDRAAAKFIYYRHDPQVNGTISDDHITALLEDEAGSIWIGSGNGLDRLIPQHGGQPRVEHLQVKDSLTMQEVVIQALYQDNDGMLWIGTSSGLYRYDLATRQFRHYQHQHDVPGSLSSNNVRCIREDNNGYLWVGTDSGLNRMDRQRGTFTLFRRENGRAGTISGNRISSLHVDEYGTLWVGTASNGLNKWDKKTSQFQYITEENGIANNAIYGIIEDQHDNLWLSTNRGLTRYNVINKSVRNYDISDGLQSEEFNAGAFHRGRSGLFYFGSINGLTAFYPDSIDSEIFVPPIRITDFRLFNKSIIPGENSVLGKAITETREIELSYKQDVFSFEFAALNFSAPHKTRYCYKMEGFDENWIFTDAKNRTATYTNLPHGTYTFTVKATNSNGTWNENGATIQVIIRPPFWLTWWFRGAVILLMTAAVIAWYRVRINRITQQKQVLEELIKLRTVEILQQKEKIEDQRNDLDRQKKQVEAQYVFLQQINDKLRQSENELSELNAAKNKFFSILAHDLRSPLNSLSGFSQMLATFADELSREEIKKMASDLNANVKTAIKYLENLLTWARAQMNSIEFEPQLLPLKDIVQVSVELLQVNANSKNIDIELEIPQDMQVYADQNQLNTIVTNLMTNAIKFTEPGGKVSVKAHHGESEMIEVAVCDTGVGMPEEVMHKIFRIDSKHSTQGTKGEKGTGLGLLLCKEFVERNGGKIWVESKEGEGSKFHFTLPANEVVEEKAG